MGASARKARPRTTSFELQRIKASPTGLPKTYIRNILHHPPQVVSVSRIVVAVSTITMTADQEVADTSRSPRFTQWCSLLVFSTVVLGAAVEASKHNGEGDEKTEQFERLSITCASLTFAVVIIVILMHFNGITSLFIVGTKIEGFICLVLAGLWAGTVAVVADSRHGLAVNNRGEVSNGNL